jgi:hypothetical protein
MNAPLGYALLRDRRVSLRPKFMALGAGLAVMGIIQLLQIPFESVLALVLPGVGAAGDVAVDGADPVDAVPGSSKHRSGTARRACDSGVNRTGRDEHQVIRVLRWPEGTVDRFCER